MKSNLPLFLSMIFIQCLHAQVPVISSFSPAFGPAGTSVTITGSNFSSNTNNNIVYFGATRAVVTNASNSSLTVTVPRSTSFKPIQVIVQPAGLSAFSVYPFMTTFPGGEKPLTATSFEIAYFHSFISGINTNDFAVGDLDNDGRPDMIALSDPGGNGHYFTIFRNTTVRNQVSFATPVQSPQYTGFQAASVCISDIDGDGMPELLIGFGERISIYRNTSTPGSISFAAPLLLITTFNAEVKSIEVSDLDKDGKPDIIFMNSGALSVIKNNSTPGNFSLAAQQVIFPATAQTIRNEVVRIADLDGDSKPDLAVSYFWIDSIYAFRNLSTPGTISFESPERYGLGANNKPESMAISDLDMDGKPDLFFSNKDKVTMLKNNSINGKIILSGFSGFSPLFFSYNAEPGDVDGDGRNDVITNHSFAGAAIFRNNSTPCTPQFDPIANFGGSEITDIAICEISGDGKTDIIIRRNSGITVLKNTVGQSLQLCSGGNGTIFSSLTGTTYQWQQNTGTGYTSISNGANFNGTNTTTLQLINIPQSWNSFKYRCIVDTDTSNAYTLLVNNSLAPSAQISHCPAVTCAGNSTNFTVMVTHGGITTSYQWQDSSNAAGWTNISGATSSTLTSYIPPITGTKIRCAVTSSYSCASPAQVNSNTVILNFAASVIPSVTISTPQTTICAGASVTFLASPVNGGVNPSYQWQVNGSNVGTNSNAYTTSALTHGAQVRVILTSNVTCASPANVNSNIITMTVNALVQPSISITGNTTVNIGQSTSLSATAVNGGAGPQYKWQDSTNTHSWQDISGATTALINYTPSQTGNKIRCLLTSNANCLSANTATSNTLIFTVTTVTAINPMPGSYYGIKFFPNPASDFLYIDSLRVSDKWVTLEVLNTLGERVILLSVSGKRNVQMPLANLSRGQYFIIFRRNSGAPAFLRLIKQ